jgi:hypothetical protein
MDSEIREALENSVLARLQEITPTPLCAPQHKRMGRFRSAYRAWIKHGGQKRDAWHYAARVWWRHWFTVN